MIAQYSLQVLTLAAIIISGFILKNYYPKYFEEKGKNLATKEDISEITNLVEQVKHSFTKDAEKFKANLFLLTNVQVGLIAEEKNAIIDYNEKIFKWQQMLIDTSLGGIDDYDDDELEKYKGLVQQRYIDSLNSETRFSLFVDNQELARFADKIKIATLTHLLNLMQKYIIELKSNNFYIKSNKNSPPSRQQTDKNLELLDSRKKIMDEFNKGMVTGYKNVVQLNYEFKKMSRDHIFKLLSKQEE